jgi:hypothetical protein
MTKKDRKRLIRRLNKGGIASLIGNADLAWFLLGTQADDSDQPIEGHEAIFVLKRRDPKATGKRPTVILRLKDFATTQELAEGMKQAENDLLFGTPDVGTVTWIDP